MDFSRIISIIPLTMIANRGYNSRYNTPGTSNSPPLTRRGRITIDKSSTTYVLTIWGHTFTAFTFIVHVLFFGATTKNNTSPHGKQVHILLFCTTTLYWYTTVTIWSCSIEKNIWISWAIITPLGWHYLVQSVLAGPAQTLPLQLRLPVEWVLLTIESEMACSLLARKYIKFSVMEIIDKSRER